MRKFIWFFLVFALGCNNSEKSTSETIDVDTNQLFDEVKIGNQVWMVENLNVDKFRNGDSIPQAKTDVEWEIAGLNGKPAWCYYGHDPDNGAKYGRLYNWWAINYYGGIAPEGWRIPTDSDWKILIDFLGGPKLAGKKLKHSNGWNSNGNGNNESGFSGIPGGYRDFDQIKFGEQNMYNFDFIGNYGLWWSNTQYQDFVIVSYVLTSGSSIVDKNYLHAGAGLSVRCIKD